MKRINVAGKLTVSRNAEHDNFHREILDVITAEFAAAQKIDALRAAYKELFDKEDEAFVLSRALTGTADVEAKDAARDELTRYVCLEVDAKQYSPVDEVKAAAKRLRVKIDPYWRAHTKPYAENTALVANMVQDMQAEDNAADTAAIGLTDIVAKLKTANDDFDAAYTNRTDEKQTREATEKMKSVRPQVDEAYRAVVEAINSLYNVNAVITHDAAAETALGDVIDKVNARILQLDETVGIRLAKAANKAKKTTTEE